MHGADGGRRRRRCRRDLADVTTGIFECAVWDWNRSSPAAISHKAVAFSPVCGNCSRGWQTVGWESRGDGSPGSYGSHELGGNWYSLLEGGHCPLGERPSPAGCAWRVAGLPRIVNASCIMGRLAEAAQTNQSACFAACSDGTEVREDA